MFVLEECNHMRLNIDPPLRNGSPGFGPSGDLTMAQMQAMSRDDNIDRQTFFDNEAANRTRSNTAITERRKRNLVAVRKHRGVIERLGRIVDGGEGQLFEGQEGAVAGKEESEEEQRV